MKHWLLDPHSVPVFFFSHLPTSLKNKGAFPSDMMPVFKELGIKEKASYSSSSPPPLKWLSWIREHFHNQHSFTHSFVQEISIQGLLHAMNCGYSKESNIECPWPFGASILVKIANAQTDRDILYQMVINATWYINLGKGSKSKIVVMLEGNRGQGRGWNQAESKGVQQK